MRHVMTIVLLAVFAAAAPCADADAPHIAVLRLGDVLVSFKMYQAGKEVLQKEKAQFQASLDKVEAQLKDDDEKMHLLNQESEAYADLKLDLETTEVKHKSITEHGNETLGLHHAQLIKACYGNIHAALASYCQDHGIKLVHLAPNPELMGTDIRDVNDQMFMQSVLVLRRLARHHRRLHRLPQRALRRRGQQVGRRDPAPGHRPGAPGAGPRRRRGRTRSRPGRGAWPDRRRGSREVVHAGERRRDRRHGRG